MAAVAAVAGEREARRAEGDEAMGRWQQATARAGWEGKGRKRWRMWGVFFPIFFLGFIMGQTVFCECVREGVFATLASERTNSTGEKGEEWRDKGGRANTQGNSAGWETRQPGRAGSGGGFAGGVEAVTGGAEGAEDGEEKKRK